MTDTTLADDSAAIGKLNEAREKIIQQLSQVIVGQNEVIEELLISLFSRSHCLLEGVPGLAKTLMISTLARALNLSFSRVQFTPDLMPADITGTEVIQEDKASGVRELMAHEPFKGRRPLFIGDDITDETVFAIMPDFNGLSFSVGRRAHGVDGHFDSPSDVRNFLAQLLLG